VTGTALDRWRERFGTTLPGRVVERFFALELLDRSFALAAQAFVALLPLIIVVVAYLVTDQPTAVADQVVQRYDLTGAASAAVRVLLTVPGAPALSWLAVAMAFLSAWSLARRLSRTYAAIFEVPPLPQRQAWRGLVWIGVQLVMLISVSSLRDLRAEAGGWPAVVAASVGIPLAWAAGDWVAIRLLVPSVPGRVVRVAVALGVVARLLVAAWALVYMPRTLTGQAEQYGPIGVTFAIFTYLLVTVLLIVLAALIAAVWTERSGERRATAPAPEADHS
jgi:membrane protein